MADNALNNLLWQSRMSATPRNKLLGLLADALQSGADYAAKPDRSMPGGLLNPPLNALSSLLGLPGAARTVDRLSYGEPLTNIGKGSRTPLIPSDTVDAAGLAAMAAPVVARGANALSNAAVRGITGNNLATAQGVIDYASQMRPATPATVWHGSPHKFDKFDASKIGTGSGVDAQGVGLYFSDAKRVADAYAQPGGAVYAVDIPDEQIARMLQWQEPVAKQPRDTRKGVLKALGRDSYKDVVRYNATGSDVYNNALAYLPAEDAARLLAANGVPGIRYSGNGTTNTVLFPSAEDFLTILDRR